MRPGSGARCPAPRKARLGSSRGWGVPPGPEPPSRAGAGVPSHCPRFLLGDPRGWHCPGPPWAVGVTCTPSRPPMAGKGLGINNGHCFPLMNVTGSCGLRPGERGASPASPRPGNPQPRPAGGACGCGAGPRLDTAAACHCLGCRWGPWAELGDGGAGGGVSLPLLTSPLSLHRVWPRGKRDWLVLGEKLLQPQGCSEQPSRAVRCPRTLFLSLSSVPGQAWGREQPRDGVSPERQAGTDGAGVCKRGMLVHGGSFLALRGFALWNKITESFRVEKTFQISESKRCPPCRGTKVSQGQGTAPSPQPLLHTTARGMPSSCQSQHLPAKGVPASPHPPASASSKKPPS